MFKEADGGQDLNVASSESSVRTSLLLLTRVI